MTTLMPDSPIYTSTTTNDDSGSEKRVSLQTAILASTASALTAIILTSSLFAALMVAICKCHPRFKKRRNFEKTRRNDLENPPSSSLRAVVNDQGRVLCDGRNSIPHSTIKLLRSVEISADLASEQHGRNEEEREGDEDQWTERSYEEVNYGSLSGMYVEIEDASPNNDTDTDTRNIRLTKNQALLWSTCYSPSENAACRQ